MTNEQFAPATITQSFCGQMTYTRWVVDGWGEAEEGVCEVVSTLFYSKTLNVCGSRKATPRTHYPESFMGFNRFMWMVECMLLFLLIGRGAKVEQLLRNWSVDKLWLIDALAPNWQYFVGSGWWSQDVCLSGWGWNLIFYIDKNYCYYVVSEYWVLWWGWFCKY